jgi:hypothetical protein
MGTCPGRGGGPNIFLGYVPQYISQLRVTEEYIPIYSLVMCNQ